MKNSFLQSIKKLSKKELKTIAGGMLNCMEPILCTEYPCETFPTGDPRACSKISIGCAQKQCRPQPETPIE